MKYEELAERGTALVALTGPMGGGKSAAGRAFARFGARVIDADALSREILFGDADAKARIREIAGGECFGPSGVPVPRKIAAAVFSSPEKLAACEAVLHPKIEAAWRARVAERGVTVVEIPLLFEKSLEKGFDICATLFCSEPIRISRLAGRGFSPAQIAARDSFQMPQAEKAARADAVFFNDGSVEFLEEQIRIFLSRFRK